MMDQYYELYNSAKINLLWTKKWFNTTIDVHMNDINILLACMDQQLPLVTTDQ